ncbi:MAG: hypothetical protein JW891_15515 [Candidatus Lokiarchaeota archaeon]|nr:hypothetical protein [Candidatus Lokiarchaeota archaeon]
MAKKKKETCPYCGKSFAYLSRHKCKIKERVEGTTDEKSDSERRIERIEEKKKNYSRDLRKDEKAILSIIEKEKDIYFNELLEMTQENRDYLEPILEQLALQSKITIERELRESSWTKRIKSIEKIDMDVDETEVDMNNDRFIWEKFGYIPCFVCPYEEKCNDTNLDQFNPNYCQWLTDWIQANIQGTEYIIDFDTIQEYMEES